MLTLRLLPDDNESGAPDSADGAGLLLALRVMAMPSDDKLRRGNVVAREIDGAAVKVTVSSKPDRDGVTAGRDGLCRGSGVSSKVWSIRRSFEEVGEMPRNVPASSRAAASVDP